jgi:Domain of unknown function (DUF4157)
MKTHAQRPDPISRAIEQPTKQEPKRSIMDAKNASGAELASGDMANPVNAPRVAGILNELQHSVGNRQVQRMLSESDNRSFPLDTQARATMEPALGGDFSEVRLHTGEEAATLAGSEQALAVTRGKDVYFAAGEYDPHSATGREVLAHELAHVVQQDRETPSSSAGVESEARSAARSAAAGQPAVIRQGADRTSLHAIKKDDLAAKTEKPKDDKQAGEPKPPVKPEMAAAAFHLTPAIVEAVSLISTSVAFEDRAIEIFAAGDSDRPRLLLNLVMLFPAAAGELAKQQPPNVERTGFMQLFAKFLWGEVGRDFLNTIDHRYEADKAFKRKVDKARGKIETPQPASETPAR